MLGIVGGGHHHNASRKVPCENDLRRRDCVLFGDFTDDWVFSYGRITYIAFRA